MTAKGKIFRRLFTWHRWLGLFLGLHLLILMLTGTLLVFKDEFQQEGKFPAAPAMQKLSLQTILDDAIRQDPSGRPLAVQFAEHDPDQLTIRMGDKGSTKFSGSKRLNFDRYLGAQASLVKPNGFWDFTLRLHREFLLGFYGKLYLGFIGILFILSLLSGLYIFGPTSLRLAFGSIREGKKSWTFSDLHKMIGAGSFAWLGLIAFTGTLLATSGQLLKIYQYTELKSLNEKYPSQLNGPLASLDKAEDSVRTIKPQSEISFITFPGTEFATTGQFVFVVNDKDGWKKYLSEIILVDGTSGSVVEVRSLPLYLKAAILSEPLHFGNYGGLPLKLIWVGFGCLGLFLSLSGPYLSYLKKRKFQPGARSPSNPQKRSKDQSPYLIPAIYSVLIVSGSLIAMSPNQGLDLFSCVLLAIPLFFILKKLIRTIISISAPMLFGREK